jgi:hypothetical protein
MANTGDIPSGITLTANQSVRRNAADNAFEAYTPGGGSSTFTALTDAPATYVGQTLKVVRVNAGETALEFVTLAGGGDLVSTNNLSDVASAATSRTNLGLGTVATQASTALSGTFSYGLFAINDNADDHKLTVRVAEDLSANRTLNIITGDATRTLTITADTTLGGTPLTQPQIMARALGC